MVKFTPGQLVKRRKPIAWPMTSFTALTARYTEDIWTQDSQGRTVYAGQVNIDYEDIGLCVSVCFPDGTMTVLFGEHLVIQSICSMVPYED